MSAKADPPLAYFMRAAEPPGAAVVYRVSRPGHGFVSEVWRDGRWVHDDDIYRRYLNGFDADVEETTEAEAMRLIAQRQARQGGGTTTGTAASTRIAKHRGSADAAYSARVFSARLVGLPGDCSVSCCDARELGTGYAVYRKGDAGWYVEFDCPKHGNAVKWRKQDEALVAEVLADLRDQGVDMARLVAGQLTGEA